jgi:transposase-like protein
MRYPASEKLEIIRLVEQSHLPAKKTLDKLGIARRSFYHWYDRYLEGGPEALEDPPSRPGRVWNRIDADIQGQIIEMALEQSELSSRELAVRFTDEKRYFVSEASVYRLLKAHDLITSPAFIVVKAADEFKDKTTAPNQMWQIDFTYFKIIDWGWCICPPYSMTSLATSLPGSCARPCAPRTSPIRSNWPLRLQAATTPRWCTSPDCMLERSGWILIFPFGVRFLPCRRIVARSAVGRLPLAKCADQAGCVTEPHRFAFRIHR